MDSTEVGPQRCDKTEDKKFDFLIFRVNLLAGNQSCIFVNSVFTTSSSVLGFLLDHSKLVSSANGWKLNILHEEY